MKTFAVVLLALLGVGLLALLGWSVTVIPELMAERAARKQQDVVIAQLREQARLLELQYAEAATALTACKQQQIQSKLNVDLAKDPVDAANAVLRELRRVRTP